MIHRRELQVETLPIDQITIVNPRVRGTAKFRMIVASIAKLGLKRPITVARRTLRTGTVQYDLVCGQGRLEAYKALGQQEVQAVVIEATKEELLLMSLTENLARRVRTSGELMQSITALKEAGYSFSTIAEKTDLSINYVKGILRLISKGEDRLVRAVEHGDIPIAIAVTITSADDAEVQRALTEAYEKNSLRGKELLRARRIIEQRRTLGKGLRTQLPARAPGDDSEKLLETYQNEAARQTLMIKRAKICQSRLMFVVSALRQLLLDEEFVRLLKAEALDAIPKHLSDQIQGRKA